MAIGELTFASTWSLAEFRRSTWASRLVGPKERSHGLESFALLAIRLRELIKLDTRAAQTEWELYQLRLLSKELGARNIDCQHRENSETPWRSKTLRMRSFRLFLLEYRTSHYRTRKHSAFECRTTGKHAGPDCSPRGNSLHLETF